jgi:hypothetical protein
MAENEAFRKVIHSKHSRLTGKKKAQHVAETV